MTPVSMTFIFRRLSDYTEMGYNYVFAFIIGPWRNLCSGKDS